MIDFKKLKDLIIEKKCIASNDYGKDDPFVGIYWEDLVEIIKQCDTTKWISVDEVLPKFGELILVDGKTGLKLSIYMNTFADATSITNSIKDVTHWMPIPSLKGGEK